MTQPKEHFRIYHNPRCSKSREALQLLRDRGIEPEIVEYLKSPISASMLREILRHLRLKPADLLRTKEPVFASLKLDLQNDAAVINAICENPVLLERPIVIAGKKGVVGRPPEKVLELLR